MIRDRGIAFKMGAPVLAGVALVFLVVLVSGYLNSRETILRKVEENAQHLALRIAHRIEAVLAPVERIPSGLATLMETLPLNEAQTISLLSTTLTRNPDIFGAAIAFEPHGFDPARRYFSPYVSRAGNDIRLNFLGGEAYNYFHHDWYQVPRETGAAGWSEPYFDEGGGGILMTTFSHPFYRNQAGERRMAGVVTADISLDWLEATVTQMHILHSGYGFIISQDGTFIVHPERRWVINETIFSVAEARNDPGLRKLGQRMVGGAAGFVPFAGDMSRRDGFLYFAPIGHSRWSLGIFFPTAELMADMDDLTRKAAFLAACGLLLLVLVVWLVARTITRPLAALSGAARQMATGDLDVVVPGLGGGGEVGVLARSLNDMKKDLRQHIQELLDTTAAKERIESELNVAREIQMGLLPKIFPPFPDIPGFDLFALIEPAREVGGDLYDFYRIDEDRICFILGDVSGKSVPASLFMAVTMTLIKMTAAKGLEPGRILQEVNNQLSRDNEAAMFVTLFCAILDIRTGELCYANGGHNPPILLRHQAAPEFLEGTDGALLGAMEDIDYEMKRIVLAPGEGLFVYSDGVTEAADAQENLYSDERLLALFKTIEHRSPARVVDEVMHSVRTFAGETPQADDITMMMVRFGESRQRSH